jgi:hypothetical protein
MIAQNIQGSGGSRPRFSAAVAGALSAAMSEFREDSPASEATLRSALAMAAADAQNQGFGPEHVVLALKAVQNDVGDRLSRTGEARERFQTFLLRGMLTAYFGQREPGDQ